MIYKLTPRIWFSDLQGANETDAPVVIGVSNNACMTNPKVHAYFRHVAGDDDEVDALYLRRLGFIYNLIRDRITDQDEPLLVHCLSGQHRSANVAVMLAFWESLDSPGDYARWWKYAKEIRGGDIGRGKFARSLVKTAGVMSDEEFMRL